MVALILSACPELAGQVEAVEQIIEQTAAPKYGLRDCSDNIGQDYPNNTYGYGLVDALAAVNMALNCTAVAAPEMPAPQARVFPNPTSSEVVFDLQASPGYTVLEIFAADRRLVFTKTWVAQSRELVQVSLENLPDGIYFWQVRAENGMLSGKLVKE
jgi:hypothetical protein